MGCVGLLDVTRERWLSDRAGRGGGDDGGKKGNEIDGRVGMESGEQRDEGTGTYGG